MIMEQYQPTVAESSDNSNKNADDGCDFPCAESVDTRCLTRFPELSLCPLYLMVRKKTNE
jgi:hypothetical protein